MFLFGYTVQAITGFAGNIFCMPVGTLTLGLQSSVSILNATGFLACTVLAVLNIRSIHWRELGKIVGVMLPFVVLGAWLDSVVPLHALLKIYGLVILAVGIKNLVQRKQSFLPEWALWGVLVAAGLIQGMFVSGGALLVIYAVQKLTDKDQFRATLSAVWSILNLVWSILNLLYAGAQLYQGHFTHEVWVMVLCCVPLIVLATRQAHQPGALPEADVRVAAGHRHRFAGRREPCLKQKSGAEGPTFSSCLFRRSLCGLVLLDYQHVAADVADEVRGNAAHEHVLDVAQAALAADDQVGLGGLDELLLQRVGDAAGTDDQLYGGDVGVVADLLQQVGKVGLDADLALVAQKLEVDARGLAGARNR